MVQHFLNNGWFIQSCIGGVMNKVFDPEIKLKLPSVKIAPDNAVFHVGDKFRVKSTLCELEIANTESKEIHLKYTNRSKPNFIASEEIISRNLSFEVWIKL